MSESRKSPKIVAVCGKGGVGKTSISALLVRSMMKDKDKRVLAIDADPAVGLATALGFEVYRTVDTIRNDLIGRIQEGRGGDREEILSRLDYEVMDSLVERDNLAFLAIGRPETVGCYCRVNDLLKDIIRDISHNFDLVVIDAEAGIEQVNRRVMEMVSRLLLVSDVSAKGRAVVKSIQDVAERLVSFERTGVLFNRLRDSQEAGELTSSMDMPVLGWIGEEELIRQYDRDGKSIPDMPSCNAVEVIDRIVDSFVFDRVSA